jgi:hypothetical protein
MRQYIDQKDKYVRNSVEFTAILTSHACCLPSNLMYFPCKGIDHRLPILLATIIGRILLPMVMVMATLSACLDV